MTLQGARCTLRRWRTSDAASVVRHANNPNVAKHLRDRFPHPYTPNDAQAFLTAASREAPQTNFAIEVRGIAVGGLGYVPGTDVERYSAEVGYWLGETCWGRGIMTDALVLFTRHAFAELGLLRLFAMPLSGQRRVDPRPREGRLHRRGHPSFELREVRAAPGSGHLRCGERSMVGLPLAEREVAKRHRPQGRFATALDAARVAMEVS